MYIADNIFVHILNAKGEFSIVFDAVNSSISKTVELVRTLLPIKNIDIIVQHAPENVIEVLGVGGYTPNAHTIYISLDATRANILDIINNELIHTLVHEMHHAVRWNTVGYGETLGEALVTEGLADHFDTELTGASAAIWTKSLSGDDLLNLLERARKEFDNSDYSHSDWFFGGNGFPKWGGYSLGYYIVSQYLSHHPNKKASSLYDINAAEILKTV